MVAVLPGTDVLPSVSALEWAVEQPRNPFIDFDSHPYCSRSPITGFRVKGNLKQSACRHPSDICDSQLIFWQEHGASWCWLPLRSSSVSSKAGRKCSPVSKATIGDVRYSGRSIWPSTWNFPETTRP